MWLEDAQITMLGFRGMKENRWGAGRTQRRGDIMAYLSGFTQTGNNNLTSQYVHLMMDEVDSGRDGLVNRDIAYPFDFSIDHVPEERMQGFHQAAKIQDLYRIDEECLSGLL